MAPLPANFESEAEAADGEGELGLPVKVSPVDADLSAEGNRSGGPNESRKKGEEKRKQNDGLLHGFTFVGQLGGQVKGTGRA